MRAVVEATPGMTLVGEAACGEEALLAVDELSPELVIVDVRLPGMDGVELARILFERAPAPVVLLVSAQSPPLSLPAAADGSVVAFAAKQRLCPSLLRQVWDSRGRLEPLAGAGPDGAT